MRPTFHHELASARIADLRHDATRDRIALAAIQGLRAQAHHPARSGRAHTGTGLTRRVLTQADGHPSPAR